MPWTRPDLEQIRAALQQYAPQLANVPIEHLADGWECWTFRAGEYVLRFPKQERGYVWKLGDQSSSESFRIERALTPELADQLTTPIAVVEIYGEDGPNGAPFVGHRYLPGEVVLQASRPPAASFGAEVGRFLSGLHSFPAQRALELGVPFFDGDALRRERVEHYEAVIRRAFPLVSCEARTHVAEVYEAYLNDAASFEFEPCLVHTDLAINVLIDESGRLSGVIDFSDAAVSSPALDYWLPVYGFKQLGIEEQLSACLAEAGIDDAQLERMRPELAFLDVRYPLLGILHGLATDDAECVEESIHELNALIPQHLRC